IAVRGVHNCASSAVIYRVTCVDLPRTPSSTLFPYTTLFRSRSLRTSIQFSGTEGMPKTLMVSSSEPGEAKSTTSRKLATDFGARSEEHTSELQSREKLVCRLRLEKKKPGSL